MCHLVYDTERCGGLSDLGEILYGTRYFLHFLIQVDGLAGVSKWLIGL